MHTLDSIRKVCDIFSKQKLDPPEKAGVYAFWWIGDKNGLLDANHHIVFKGPAEKPVDVEYIDWWPSDLVYPCLYVGKSTLFKKRFSLHINREIPDRLHKIPTGNQKQKGVTTPCQLRYGIEHIFENHKAPLKIISNM